MLNTECWDAMGSEKYNNINLIASKIGKSTEDWVKEFIIDEYTPALITALKHGFTSGQILDLLKCELRKHDTKEDKTPCVENTDNLLL